MPSLCKRACSTPGCRNAATNGSRCADCAKKRQREYDDKRGSSAARGYGANHQRLRVLAFQRDQWRCADCGWRPQIVVDCEQAGLDEPPTSVILDYLRLAFNRGERHLHCDHVIPIEQQPELALDLDNLRTRCNLCHAAKTMTELRQKL